MKPAIVSPIPKPNVATNLALRFLLPASAEDQADALEGLTAVCLRALRGRGLYLIPADVTTRENTLVDPGASRREATGQFVLDWLTADFFGPHYTQSPTEIDTPANCKKFRYVGNACRSAVKDEYKRRKAAKRGGGVQDLTLMEAYHQGIFPDPPVRERLIASNLVPDTFTKGRAQIEQALGTKSYATLSAILNAIVDPEGSRIVRKGDGARVVAKRLGVSVQQARTNIRDLTADIARLKAATVTVPLLEDLFEEIKKILTPIWRPTPAPTHSASGWDQWDQDDNTWAHGDCAWEHLSAGGSRDTGDDERTLEERARIMKRLVECRPDYLPFQTDQAEEVDEDGLSFSATEIE